MSEDVFFLEFRMVYSMGVFRFKYEGTGKSNKLKIRFRK